MRPNHPPESLQSSPDKTVRARKLKLLQNIPSHILEQYKYLKNLDEHTKTRRLIITGPLVNGPNLPVTQESLIQKKKKDSLEA